MNKWMNKCVCVNLVLYKTYRKIFPRFSILPNDLYSSARFPWNPEVPFVSVESLHQFIFVIMVFDGDE